jgi:UDP-N-acetylmuramoyl-L-alanyl-D-glutamate--2,6-diaminopimelate ligase
MPSQLLSQLLSKLPTQQIVGDTNLFIQKIDFDTRKVAAGSLFVAQRGTVVDGHQFIGKAIAQGATAVICETLPTELLPNVTYIEVKDSNEMLGRLSANFYDNPSKKLKLVGVTGTNGKTTTVTLLHDLYTQLGYKVGLLSTVENKIGQKIIPSTHTTPDAVQLNALLDDMVEEGCEFAFMEVSSHAIHQRRIAGLHFVGAIFTNITHDHLDYHKTFLEYINAKKRFFDDLDKSAFALVNLDDKRGEVMLQNTKAKKQYLSIRTLADFKAKIVENSIEGLQLDLQGEEFHCRLIGEFNAYNILTVYATAMLLGSEKEEVLPILSNLRGAEGRFEYIRNQQMDLTGIIDYAHTPDALEKVLATIHKLNAGKARILTVVGCGGDRDKGKRPIMAKTACDYSHQVILTSDNPRTEDPDQILKDMEAGVPIEARHKYLLIPSREQAIKTACRLAQHGDFILVAGKGHEKYQDINGVKHVFDDKVELEKGFFN